MNDVSDRIHERARQLLELGRPQEALEELAQPGVDAEDANTWYLLGLAWIELDRDDEALEVVGRGLAVAPDSWSLLDLLSLIHLNRGNLVEAEAAVLAALRQYTESPHLLCRYAQIVAGAGQVAKAEALVERAANIDPEGAPVTRMRALLAYAKGESRAAVTHSRALLALDPSDPYGHFLHGEMLRTSGDLDGAHHHFGTAVVGNPAHENYADMARQARLQSHWLLWPLRPLIRFGIVPIWLFAMATLIGLTQLDDERPAMAATIFWVVYVIYSWVVPPLLRWWMRR